MTTTRRAYARVGLIGNPSDGFFGKTIAFTFDAFRASVTLWESPELVIEPQATDRSHFRDMKDLVNDVYYTGYYGGVRLVKAAVKKFYEVVNHRDDIDLSRNFTVRYSTTIPMRVGLAGSSAIIIATFRAMMDFYGVSIPPEQLASLALKVETAELGIPAGLQDRVVQAYEGLVYMDFDRGRLEDYGHGLYERLDPELLPPLYVAYCTRMGEGTEVTHSDLRYRFERGDMKVRRAMKRFAVLTESMRVALEDGKLGRMHHLLNENFDLRASLVKIAPRFLDMVNVARNCGVSAKFCGSGGAIVGIAGPDEIEQLKKQLAPLDVETIIPRVAGHGSAEESSGLPAEAGTRSECGADGESDSKAEKKEGS